MRKFIFTAMLLLFSVPASAQWYGYSSWDRLPKEGRVGYVMGIADSLMIFAASDSDIRTAQHRQACLIKSGMTGQQFTENVSNYAKMHPQLQGGTVQIIVVNYLNELCGLPQ
jgi:hypothetical protein